MLQKTRRTHSRLIVGWSVVSLTTQESCWLATTRGCDATVPVHRWSLLVLISTTGGLAPHDHDASLVETGRDPKTQGRRPKDRPSDQGDDSDPGLASERDRFLNCLSGIGTDTITTHGHPAFDAQELWGGHPSCDPAPLTTSFGTVALRERQHRAITPQYGRQPQPPSAASSLPVQRPNSTMDLRVVPATAPSSR